ncbi:TPA: hypothetical protein ACKP7A_002281 [Serratia liquefaciens]|uniref:hypothetical protein n=1 Tax=Serratia liquefaciens TaxID=614 RepID=UPI00101F742E|nr:hypothetical protein [Serratia liquefaciens]MBH2811897.1 hypothetical protein [Serratia liquefaciens]MDU4172941.1 hypothetical protein [Serratia liquefaciens]HCT7987123.1 hypothetical protein [Serratia liquefaciens]
MPASLYETVEGIVKMGLSPVDTWNSISALFDGDGVLSNVSGAVKQSYIDRIDKLTTEYQKAGASGSFNAGGEGGKLLTDIAVLSPLSAGAVTREEMRTLDVGYPDGGGVRPDAFRVTAIIDGVPKTYTFIQ